MFHVAVIFLYETDQKQLIFGQHCEYQWPGALAPEHQYTPMHFQLFLDPCVLRDGI